MWYYNWLQYNIHQANCIDILMEARKMSNEDANVCFKIFTNFSWINIKVWIKYMSFTQIFSIQSENYDFETIRIANDTNIIVASKRLKESKENYG